MSNARVKLFTLWGGELPPWFGQFEERIQANRTVLDWELVRFDQTAEFNRFVTDRFKVPCRKDRPYAMSDLRPLYGELFADRLAGYEWWGWVDLDVVLGDLNRLLPPLLNAHDVISTDREGTHGAMTLLRNTPEINALCRQGGLPGEPLLSEILEVLADRDYWNYDEVGFNEGPFRPNPSFTQIVWEADWLRGFNVRWDDRSWTENRETIEDGLPSRCCDLRNSRLIEIPTQRELLLYHFTGCHPSYRKEWPIPHPAYVHYDSLLGLQREYYQNRSKPARPPFLDPPPDPRPVYRPETLADKVESPDYWMHRLGRVLASAEPLYRAVCDTPPGDWEKLQQQAAAALRYYIKPGEKILDGGCGYGALVEPLTQAQPEFGLYVGVDYCLSMVQMAETLLEAGKMGVKDGRICFMLGNLNNLPFLNDQFDWAVCRGVEGTTRVQLGNRVWSRMRDEMLRVARRLLLIHLDGRHRVVERLDPLS